MKHIPLTEQVHKQLADMLAPGDIVIDATAGNGHDTLFLAECVGETGQVFAIDIQPDAINSARTRLQRAGQVQQVEWLCHGHEHIAQLIQAELHGRIAAIVFNLGFLPGSDKKIKTQTETSLAALQQSYAVLRQGGLLSVMVYSGHAGGEEEAEAVKTWFEKLGCDYTLVSPDSKNAPAPQWFWLNKKNPL